MAVRIAILSDDRLFADGLVRIVKADDGLAVAGAVESRDGWQAALAQRPHILIIDSTLANATALCARASGGLRRTAGAPSVVFVAAPEDDDWAIEALTAGARGILSKRAAPGDLHKALRAVAEGQIWSSRRVLTTWLARLTSPANPAPVNAVRYELDALLSDREQEVFRHAATGLGNKELAAALSISEATIKVHMTRIFQKLGLRGRGELAAAYYGLLPRRAADGARPGISRSA
jgi:DNA-binding NarL/FixJ family response regulator